MTPEEKVSTELRDIADELTKRLEEVAGQHMNFSLLVFHTKPGSRMNYISNTKREDVVYAMKSLLKGWEEGMPDIPAHHYKD